MVNMNIERLKKYKEILPSRVTVTIEKTEQGLYAKIEELEHCYTQADNFVELIDMVNDAVFCYLDIPDECRGGLGFYAPDKLIEEVQQAHWQEAVKQLLMDNVGSSTPSVFSIVKSVAQKD